MNPLLEHRPAETTVGSHFISNYPPFGAWSPAALPALERALAAAPKPPGRATSLYLHLPFCRQRCNYCYYRVYPRRDEAAVSAYVGALLAEYDLYQRTPGFGGRPFNAVYFGGGTPSYLNAVQLRRLLGRLHEDGRWREVEECTFECEPGTVDRDKYALLRELGVTRVSVGFQSLNDEVLRRSGRDLTAAESIDAYELARAAGFEQINVDLLAGLPGETVASWLVTVDRVIGLAPDCVTIYQLELTYNSGFYGSMKAGRKLALPGWQAKEDWTGAAFARLEAAGYQVVSGYMAVRDPDTWKFTYTVEHFWKGDDLLALGESSFGHLDGVHYQNHDTHGAYLDALAAGRFPWRRAYAISRREELHREIILQLKTGRLELDYFRDKFGVDPREYFAEQWQELFEDGLVKVDDDLVELTRPALLNVDWLLSRFYLPQHAGIRYT